MENNKIFTKVYGWMFIGLLISFITGYYVSTKPNMVYNMYNGILALLEIGVCIWLSAGIRKMQPMTAKILFALYSFITGLTLSFIFVAFKLDSIVFVFGITSAVFAIMALIGTLTNIDLTKLETILFMGLIGIILASLINLIVGSQAFDLGITIIGIIIFTLYIAYDVQKIKLVAQSLEEDEDKAAIISAFVLYLDFINLFIKLIRLFGKSKD